MARLGYTNQDFLNLLLIYGECDRIAARACRVFVERYPDKPHPTGYTIQTLITNCLREGGFRSRSTKKKPITENEESEVNTLGYFEANPTNSIREASRDLGISFSSIQRILSKHKRHPFSFYNVQSLILGDSQRRIQFCQWLLLRCQEDERFLEDIIWTDEAKFTRNGMYNRHNSHYWSDVNPNLIRPVHHQDTWSFNIFCAIKYNRVLCFHIYQETLNSTRYLNILETVVLPAVENLPLLEYTRAVYQHDGAPPHNATIISEFLEREFDGNWIGNNGPYNWPPRSPDITPMDFFLWGTIKDRVYSTIPTTQDNMKNRVRDALNSLTPDVIRKATCNSLVKRIELCLQQQGETFENILKQRF